MDGQCTIESEHQEPLSSFNLQAHLEGTIATFTGHRRVWNERHCDDEQAKPNGSSNRTTFSKCIRRGICRPTTKRLRIMHSSRRHQ